MSENKEKKISYVTVSEVSIENLVESAKGFSQGQRKATAQSGKAWAQTSLWLHGHKDLSTYDATVDVKDIAESVRNTFKDHFLSERADAIGEITEETEGRNARTGKMIAILDKDGQPKWSSWEETKLPISYCGDIAQVIKAGLTGALLKSAKSVMARVDILSQCKVPETPLKTIERSCLMIAQKGEQLPITEIDDAILLVEIAMKELITLQATMEAAQEAKAA